MLISHDSLAEFAKFIKQIKAYEVRMRRFTFGELRSMHNVFTIIIIYVEIYVFKYFF